MACLLQKVLSRAETRIKSEYTSRCSHTWYNLAGLSGRTVSFTSNTGV